MARTFNGTTQYASKAIAALTAYPATFACWVNASSFSTNGAALCIGSSTASAHTNLLLWSRTSTNFESTVQDTTAGTQSNMFSTTTASTATWYHICMVHTSAAVHAYYTNGVSEATDATSVTLTAADLNVTLIGAFQDAGGAITTFWPGSIAFPAIWNVALTTPEILQLAQGLSPRKVHPSALVSCPRLDGVNSPEPDMVSSTGFTLTAAPTVSANPRIVVP